MPPSPRLTVIVLNFRTPDVTIDCLKTLAPEALANPGMKVVLLDNASGDDSVPRIEAAIRENGWTGDWLEFRPLDKNLGFAGGNNRILHEQMAAKDPPAYLLLLNSDTLAGKGCIAYCTKIMEADPKIGALSCMLRNRDGSVQNICRKFPHPARESVRAFGLPWFLPALFRWADLEDSGWDRTAGPRDVDWIGGAFFFARTSALREAGVLDQEFFFYGEDCEWCHRLWKHGWRIRFDPGAETVHLGGASSDSTRVRNRQRDIYTWKARFLIQRKCYGPLAEKFVRGCYTAMFALRLGFARITGRGRSEKAAELREGLSMLLGPLDK
ncbi:MAG: glycosyltransferase family 2 protein [Verrucomicrobiota bacterium]